MEANSPPRLSTLFRAPLWPAGSARGRAARGLGVALVLALSICSQTVAFVNSPGTNDYYGMVALHGIAAYSLIEDGTLASGSGDLGAISEEFARRSVLLKSGYVEIADVVPALRQSAPRHVLFLYPPGYALYLAGTFVVGHEYRYTMARGIQQLANMLGVPVLLLMAGHLLGCFPVGLAAAFLYGLFTGPTLQTFYILPDGLMPFMATLLLTAALWCARRDRLAGYAALGIVLGLAANLRSDALGIGVFLALGIWRWRRRLDLGTLSRVGIMASAAFVLLIPYGLIQLNFKPIGRFQVTTPALGVSLWESYGETPNPHGAVLSDAAVDEMLFQMTGRRVDLRPEGEALLKKLWLQAAMRAPGWFLWSVSNRCGTILSYWRAGVEPPFVASTRSSGARRLLIQAFNDGVANLAVGVLACGIVTILFSRLGLIIASASLSYLLAFSVLHLEPRYVIPALGPLAFSGCYGVSLVAEWLARAARHDAAVPSGSL
jgi:hypothetical protein